MFIIRVGIFCGVIVLSIASDSSPVSSVFTGFPKSYAKLSLA